MDICEVVSRMRLRIVQYPTILRLVMFHFSIDVYYDKEENFTDIFLKLNKLVMIPSILNNSHASTDKQIIKKNVKNQSILKLSKNRT